MGGRGWLLPVFQLMMARTAIEQYRLEGLHAGILRPVTDCYKAGRPCMVPPQS